MNIVQAIIDLSIDLVFILPPFDEIEAWKIPPNVAKVACFAAVILLVLALVGRSLSESALLVGQPILKWVMAITVALLAFGSVEFAIWNPIFMNAYVPLILALRFAEGAAIGEIFGQKRAWLLVPFVGLVVGIACFAVLSSLSRDAIAIIKGAWSVFAAIVASAALAAKVRPGFADVGLNVVLAAVALFFVFLSTTLYVVSSKGLGVAYTLAYPAGLSIRLAISAYARRKRQKPEF